MYQLLGDIYIDDENIYFVIKSLVSFIHFVHNKTLYNFSYFSYCVQILEAIQSNYEDEAHSFVYEELD